MNNKFYFIGNPVPAYSPIDQVLFPWNAFTRWLADERGLEEDPEYFECEEYDECELITFYGEVIGSVGKPLDRAPTAEEIRKWTEGE